MKLKFTARDGYWAAALVLVALSGVFMSRLSGYADTFRVTRDTPAVIVVPRNEAPEVVAPEAVRPPSHVIHLACDHALTEIESAIDAAVDWSGDIDRLLIGGDGKWLASDPRIVAQFQLLRGRERVGVSELRSRIHEINTIRETTSYEADDERARAVLAQVFESAAWARGVAESYRADDRLLDGMTWTARRLGMSFDGTDINLAEAARRLWSPDDLASVSEWIHSEPYDQITPPPGHLPLRPEVRARVVRSAPDRAPPSAARTPLGLVDLMRSNLEWNGLTDVSLRRRDGQIIAQGEVQTETQMAQLEAIIGSILRNSDLTFRNEVRVKS